MSHQELSSFLPALSRTHPGFRGPEGPFWVRHIGFPRGHQLFGDFLHLSRAKLLGYIGAPNALPYPLSATHTILLGPELEERRQKDGQDLPATG